ncbi:hypothetical protein DES40_1640 [Litorimonas taeanensis]|uniref:Uncharacterized protein n=1 Tax=Litorimonas taeanensis TaxID=568099 RepID=A0A420WD33_9PROT|nr:STAS/SEC14 domain-containing protein [Litorimonas taeanensis]RKQ68865.1 hypothetical protein DES40_1640 [Litorimonas taeanensis]
MTPLKTENLELTRADQIVQVTVTGAIAQESLDAGLEWVEALQASLQTSDTKQNTGPDTGPDKDAGQSYVLRVDMAEGDFSGLGQLRQQFTRIGTLLRHCTEATKCAVLTDSTFLRNSARVEGSVIPGLDLRSFDLNEAIPATRWLKGQPLLQEDNDEAPSVSDEDTAGSAWDALNMEKISL